MHKHPMLITKIQMEIKAIAAAVLQKVVVVRVVAVRSLAVVAEVVIIIGLVVIVLWLQWE